MGWVNKIRWDLLCALAERNIILSVDYFSILEEATANQTAYK